MKVHEHVWVHVSTVDWAGRRVIACKCACGRSLTPEQIVAMRAAAGMAS